MVKKKGARKLSLENRRSRKSKAAAGQRLREKEEVGILRRSQDAIRKRERRKSIKGEVLKTQKSDSTGQTLSEIRSLRLSVEALQIAGLRLIKSVVASAVEQLKDDGRELKVAPKSVIRNRKETDAERLLRLRLQKREQRAKKRQNEETDVEVDQESTVSPRSVKKRKEETVEERRLRFRLEKRAQRAKERKELTEEEYRLKIRLQRRADRLKKRNAETEEEYHLRLSVLRDQWAKKRQDRLKGDEGMSEKETRKRLLWRLRKNEQRCRDRAAKRSTELLPIALNNSDAISQILVCIVCNAEFDTQNGLKSHFVHHTESETSVAKEKLVLRDGEDSSTGNTGTEYHEVTVIKCEACSEKFYSVHIYRKHVLECHQENGELVKKICFACTVCEEAFVIRKGLILHGRNFHGIFSQCPVCNENIETQELFVKHVSEMHQDCRKKSEWIFGYADGYFCKICGLSSTSYKRLLSHAHKENSGNKFFQCEYCGDKFEEKTSMDSHKSEVHSDKLFCCELCGKRFSNKQSLRVHRRLHTGVKKIKERVECKECGKTFSTKDGYKGHYMTAHTDIRAFQCLICDKTFKSASSLNFHKFTYCEKEKIDAKICPICGKTLNNTFLLTYHKANIHKFGNTEEKFCHRCNKEMKSPLALLSHNKSCHNNKRTKQFAMECVVCGKYIPKPAALFEHWRAHREEKPYTCNLCPSTFKYCMQFSTHKKRTHVDQIEYAKMISDLEVLKMLKEDFERDHVRQIIENVNIETNSGSTAEIAEIQNNMNLVEGNVTVNEDVMIHNDVNKNYIDFSRANVPSTVVSEIQSSEPGVVHENITEELTFNQTNNDDVFNEEIFQPEGEYFSFATDEPPLSPMDYFENDCVSDVEIEDIKPLISVLKDPFKKQLIIKVEKLKECLICQEYFPSSELYEKHLGSKSHRLTRREIKKEVRAIKKAHKKKKSKGTKKRSKIKTLKKEEDNDDDDDEATKNKDLFPCPFCNETFSGLEMFRRHSRQHKPRACCLLCEEKFMTFGKLVDHYISSHDGEKTVKCEQCDKRFINYKIASNNNGLRRHMMYQHGGKKRQDKPPKNYSCIVCGEKKIANMKLLRLHVLSHNDEKHKCVHCEEEFQLAIELENHYNEIHNGDMPFPCENCTQKFPNAFRLQFHCKESHPDKERCNELVCEDCGKTFLREAYLSLHRERCHKSAEERSKFFCEFCGKSFLSNQGLQIHKRDHTGERPYQCTSCESGFKSSNLLKCHMESVHLINSTICDVCGKSFANSKNLSAHRQMHNPEKEMPCPHCSKIFYYTSRLKKHIQDVHPHDEGNSTQCYTCDICSLTFYKQKNFKKHMELHDPDRTFVCHQCPRRFKYQSNLRVHRINIHEKSSLSNA